MIDVLKFVDAGRAQALMEALWLAGAPCAANRGGVYDRQASRALRRASFDFGGMASRPQGLRRTLFWLREKALDCTVAQYAAQHPGGLVVSLGCGLSTAEFRTALGQCRWCNVDNAGVLALRRELFQETSPGLDVACSAWDPRWMDRIPSRNGEGVLFVANGIFAGARPRLFRAMFSLVACRFPGSRLVFHAVDGVAGRTAGLMQNLGGSKGPSVVCLAGGTASLQDMTPRIAGVSSRLPAEASGRAFTLGEKACMGLVRRLGLLRLVAVDFKAVVVAAGGRDR